MTFRHVVYGAPLLAAALAWFASAVENRTERLARVHIERSEERTDALRTEVQGAMTDMRSDIAELKTEVVVSGADHASRIDRLTDLLLTGQIKVRKQPPPPEEKP